MTSTGRIEIDGKIYEFPVTEGSEGERAIEIEQLRGQTQVITLDPGYKNTGSCESAITGRSSSLASAFRPWLISAISRSLREVRESPWASWR